VTLVASSLALLHFAQREVNWVSFLTSLLGFVLSFGIIALVPFDVREALITGSDDKVLAETNWELIYWATFLLCWLLCPVLIEYEAAGDFTTLGRLRTSLRRNAIWYCVYLVFGTVVLIWFSLGGGSQSPQAWCIAVSNAWGLLVSTILMGYGLVAVPQHLWSLASPSDQLRKLYCAAVTMDEARLSTQFELQDVILEARTEIATRSLTAYDTKLERAFSALQQTLEECELLHCELTNGARAPRDANHGVSATRAGDRGAHLDCLVQLHRALKQAGLEARRASCRWEELVRRCLLLEDLEERILPSVAGLVANRQADGSPCVRLLLRSPFLRSIWHWMVVFWLRTLRQRVLRFLAVVGGVMSVMIVLGQLVINCRKEYSILSWAFQSDHGFILTQVLCMLPLSYMICSSYWSVFRLKVAGWYGLYPNHNTDTCSLLWCASILARLAAPLCKHFLQLIRVERTGFQKMMGQMDAVPLLGTEFNVAFPYIVGFLCVCNLANVYSRLVHFCGLDILEFEWAPPSNADVSDVLLEGRRLVERERRRRSEAQSLIEMQERVGTGQSVPLRVQIAQLIEDGVLPNDWNAYSQ